MKDSSPTAAGHKNSTEKEGRIRATADTPLFAKFLCTDGRSALYQRSGSCLAALCGLPLNCLEFPRCIICRTCRSSVSSLSSRDVSCLALSSITREGFSYMASSNCCSADFSCTGRTACRASNSSVGSRPAACAFSSAYSAKTLSSSAEYFCSCAPQLLQTGLHGGNILAERLCACILRILKFLQKECLFGTQFL